MQLSTISVCQCGFTCYVLISIHFSMERNLISSAILVKEESDSV